MPPAFVPSSCASPYYPQASRGRNCRHVHVLCTPPPSHLHPEVRAFKMFRSFARCPHVPCPLHCIAHMFHDQLMLPAFLYAQADLSAVSFDSSSARLTFRVPRPLEHFVKHYDHVQLPNPPLPASPHPRVSDQLCKLPVLRTRRRQGQGKVQDAGCTADDELRCELTRAAIRV